VACERLGIPCATVIVIAAGRVASFDVLGEAWNRLRAEHGLDSDPDAQRLGGTLVLAPLPRSFRDPRLPSRPALRLGGLLHRLVEAAAAGEPPPIAGEAAQQPRLEELPALQALLGEG
jgi:hypothetical protein